MNNSSLITHRSSLIVLLYFALVSHLRSTALRLAVLGLTAIVFAATLWWDNAANRGIDAPSGEPIPFAGVQGGVNTYLLHAEADKANVELTFQMIADGGFGWVRVHFPWEDIEVCGKGQFTDVCRSGNNTSTWQKYDFIVEQAAEHGLELIVRLDRPPAWARQAATATSEVQQALAAGREVTGPPDDPQDYAAFVAAVAERYRGKLRFFQLWNEPNLPGEWNYRRQDPAEFVALLRTARERLLAANPQAVVVFPALSPTDGRGDGVNDLEYLQGVYDAGGGELFDIMSAQLYGLGQPPGEHRYIRPGPSLLQPIDLRADVGRVVLLREVMERNGDDRKAVWVSELGWNSAPESVPENARYTWGAPVSEQTKGEYLVQAIERARREWPWMGVMNVWMFRFGGERPLPENPTPYFELVDFDFRPLPAYQQLRDYLTQLPTVAPAQRNQLATAATLAAALGVIAATGWLFAGLSPVFWRAVAHTRRGVASLARVYAASPLARLARRDGVMLLLLGLALAIFYFASPQLPITAAGAALFGILALLRPDLALLFVPIAVPLYLAPKGVWDQRFGLSRPSGYFVPLHEFVLICVVLATAVHAVVSGFRFQVSSSATTQLDEGTSWGTPPDPRPAADVHRSSFIVHRFRGTPPRPAGSSPASPTSPASRFPMLNAQFSMVPALLLLVAGTLGVVVAQSRGAALREWRWLIVEPLLFYALVCLWGQQGMVRRRLIVAWLGTATATALVGLLQLAGLDLAALLPQSGCFSQRVVVVEGGLWRISSVYCHPNNLALALGRAWPVLLALSLGPTPLDRVSWFERRRWTLLAAAGICLLALGATLSKGAIAGAAVAAAVLAYALWRRRHPLARPAIGVCAVGVLGVLAVSLMFGWERLNPLGGSTGARIELWNAAVTMIGDRPLSGFGLDQFYFLRNEPAFGGRYITPAERETNERFASHPHNMLLDALVRIGPLGLAALAWLVWRLVSRCRGLWGSRGRAPWLALGIQAALAAALVHGLVDNFYFVPDLALWFWLMLGVVETQAPAVVNQPQQHTAAGVAQPVAEHGKLIV